MDFFKRFIQKQKNSQEKGAREALQEEWFNDYYAGRRKVYKMNFFRGIFFGLGSVIGGTVVLALLIWLLSLFVNFPVIGDTLKNVEHTLSKPK